MYAINLDENGRFLRATEPRFADNESIFVDELPEPEGDNAQYLYIDGEWVYDPIFEPEPEPSAEDDIQNMLIDQEYRLTLLELGLSEV